jgi:hypothetical protein
MGISKSHIGNWMRGTAGYPTPYEMYRFCLINGVDMNWVFLGDPSRLPRAVGDQVLGLAQTRAE